MFAKTQVADAINVAGSKATSVPKTAKRAGKAKEVFSTAQRVERALSLFAQFEHAVSNLQEAQSFFTLARLALRPELKDTYAQFKGDRKGWDEYLAKLRAGLVKRKICADAVSAGQLIRNQLKAVKLVGKGAKRGGRPEKTATGTVEKLSDKDVAARLVRILAFVAEWQQEANDDDTIGRLGTLAKLANGATE